LVLPDELKKLGRKGREVAWPSRGKVFLVKRAEDGAIRGVFTEV
jgi:hypothetical protein